MPQRILQMIEPLVRHGISELRNGESVTHVLTEVALAGALIGAGDTAAAAIRRVEAAEQSLSGTLPRGERAERFHTGTAAYANPSWEMIYLAPIPAWSMPGGSGSGEVMKMTGDSGMMP